MISGGLSPRVRGNPRRIAARMLCPRSIPACAGEPCRPVRPASPGRVYPRVCGGTARLATVTNVNKGLSPRVRGNPFQARYGQAGGGSIPACAGEPGACATIRGLRRVYPRVCGGTFVSVAAGQPGQGLSPRVRGNLARRSTPGRTPRSIPACAGEPRGGRGNLSPQTVYPRVCGGTGDGGYSRPPSGGLSPRVRGNPRRLGSQPGGKGSIPACAGEPPA